MGREDEMAQIINLRLLEANRRSAANQAALGKVRTLERSLALGSWFDIAQERDDATRLMAMGQLDSDDIIFERLLGSLERAEEFLDDYDENGGLADRQSRREKRAARKERRKSRRASRKERRGRRKEIRREYRARRKEIRKLPRGERRAARKASRSTRRAARREVRTSRKSDRRERGQVYKDEKKRIKSSRRERKDRDKSGISQSIQEVDAETAAAAGEGIDETLDTIEAEGGGSIKKLVIGGVVAVAIIGGVTILIRRRAAKKKKEK